jgi:hypothetical protein
LLLKIADYNKRKIKYQKSNIKIAICILFYGMYHW